MGAWRRLTACVLALSLAACAGAEHRLPLVTQQEISQASGEIAAAPPLQVVKRSAAQNRALVARAARRLQAAAGPLCAQVGHTPCRFNVVYDDSDEVNAYAEGDDTIVIYRGLIQYLQSEDEVAAVVAHEMGHHIAGHIGKSQVNAAAGAVISTLLFAVLMAAVSGGDPTYLNSQAFDDGLDSSAQLGSAVGQLSFSKEHEREADYLAAYLLARAGYDLDRARRLWVQLTKASGNMHTDLFDTHPAGPDRLAAWDIAVAEVAASDDLLPDLK